MRRFLLNIPAKKLINCHAMKRIMVRVALPTQRSTTVPASLFRRFLAFLLDLFALDLVVAGPFRSIFMAIFGKQELKDIMVVMESDPLMSFLAQTILLLLGLLVLLYFVILEYAVGQTLGKRIFRLRVESDRRQKKLWQYLVRSLFVIPVFPFIVLWIVDPLHQLFSIEGRRWTERLSRTRVVQDVVVEEIVPGT